jgi:hypothetical protein
MKKRKGGRRRVDSVLVGVRLPPPELAALDEWIAKHAEPRPSRPEALRRLAKYALTAKAKPQDIES